MNPGHGADQDPRSHDGGEDTTFSPAEQRLLESSIPRQELNEAWIQSTVQRTIERQRQRNRRTRLFAMVAAASISILLAAGYWRWSGRNSDEELTFGSAIELTRAIEDYPLARVQAATGKVWRDATGMLADLHAHGALRPEIVSAVQEALDAPGVVSVRYDGGLEELRWKVQAGEPLSTSEVQQVAAALRAAVAAIRDAGEREPKLATITRKLCTNVRNDLGRYSGAPPKPKDEPGPERQEPKQPREQQQR